MKQVLAFNPTFTPGGSGVGTLNFSGYSGFSLRGLLAVINETQNGALIYCPAAGNGYTAYNSGTSTITLAFDTTGYSSGDVLSCLYDNEITISGGALLTYQSQGDALTQGTLTGTGAALTAGAGSTTANVQGQYTTVLKLTGTWTGTINFFQSNDGATTDPIQGVPPNGGAVVTSTNANGEWVFNTGGFRAMWVVASGVTGTASFSINTSIAQSLVGAYVYGATAVGQAPTHPPIYISGIDQNGLKRGIATDQYGNTQVGNSPVTLQDTFTSFDTTNTWTQVATASGDIVQVDGNAISASYLAISLDPLTENTETVIESKGTWNLPLRVGALIGTSQRTLGQEFSLELVSTESPTSTITAKTVSTLNQTTTTITVVTTTSHGLQCGDRVSISGCANSNGNFSNLTVASVVNATTFTATAGSGGTITSQTITGATTGTVYYKSPVRYAPNGTAMLLDNATATNAVFVTKSNGTGALPSGTIIGNQTATVTTTASTQAINAQGAYAFQAPTVFELLANPESIEWLDHSTDASNAAYNVRFKKEQGHPDPTKAYKLRLRAINCAGLTRPVAKVVSIAKSGSTTATITTDVAHGLSTTDFIQIYGSADQSASTGNLTTATLVASVVNSTQFTVVIGSGTSGTFYGGLVSRTNGVQNLQGIITQAIQNAARTSNVLTLTGSATWAGVSIGDYVNVYGCRKTTDGSDVGVDGTYQVNNLVTTTLTLVAIGSTIGGADVSSIAAGGAVIKRTDFRIDEIRLGEFTRNIVEVYAGMNRNDQALSTAAYITGGNNITITTVTAVTTVATLTSMSQIGAVPATGTVFDIQNHTAAYVLRQGIS